MRAFKLGNKTQAPSLDRNIQVRNIKQINIRLDDVPGLVPPQVTGVDVSPGDELLVVSWSATIGDPEVTTYCVRHRVSPGDAWQPSDEGQDVGNVTNYNITGLTNGISYDVQIAAVNLIGKGPFSDTVTAAPVGTDIPTQVLNLVTIPGVVDNTLDLIWDAVVVSPVVDTYTIQYKEDSSFVWLSLAPVAALTGTIPGPLLSGVVYDTRVFATNVIGNGPPSAVVEATAEGVPEQSTIVVVPGVEQANLSITPGTSAPPVTGVMVELKLNTDTEWSNFGPLSVFTLVQNIYALDAELYDFRVTYRNTKGVGVASAIVQATPIAIGAFLEAKFDEEGLDNTSPVTFWTNTGQGSTNLDFINAFGPVQSNLTVATHKGKDHLNSAGLAGLETNGFTSGINQPYSMFACVAPSNLTGQTQLLMSDNIGAGISDQSIADNRANMYAQVDLPLFQTIPDDGTELFYSSDFNNLFSVNRVVLNDGSTDVTNSGNAGPNRHELQTMLWNPGQTFDRDFKGDVYEMRTYNGLLNAAEKQAVLGAYQQKWWLGFPGININDFDGLDFDANDFNT